MPAATPRCEIVPLDGQRTSLQIDGRERVCWHFRESDRGPFFFPLRGPSGAPLTRLGHPGAPNHDHHRSVWFAHQNVVGVDFWADTGADRIRQKSWLAYEDGDDEALMAVLLAWHDGHEPRELLQQELIVSVRPALGDPRETLLELQSRFLPTSETLEFGQTNFGFLAVRMARSISAYFGAGELTNDRGEQGEPALFGKPSRWMDYSGPVRAPASGETVTEGVTLFDHPQNPGHPVHWHVREDGWMGASACREAPLTTTRRNPLVLRYLLHAHGGAADTEQAAKQFAAFAGAAPLEVVSPRGAKHRQWLVRRASTARP